MSALPGGSLIDKLDLAFQGSSTAVSGPINLGDNGSITDYGGGGMNFLNVLSRRNPMMAVAVVIGGMLALGMGLGVIGGGGVRRRRRKR